MQSKRLKKSIQVFLITLFALVVSFCGSGFSLAQEPGVQEKAAITDESPDWKVIATSPGVKIVAETTHDPGRVLPSGENPMDAAYDWLNEEGLEEGRNLFQDKLLYVSFGSATINAKPADPNFIDSRYLAFQRAELEAKAKTAIFLGVDLTTSRGSSEREINPKERAELEAIVNSSPTLKKNVESAGVAKDIYALFKKTTRLADAKLDQALQKSGVDVKAEKQEKVQKQASQKAEKDRLGQLRNISESSLKAAASAFAEVQGTQAIQVFEGSYHNGYQVVVITLWSYNMQQLVDAMLSGKASGWMPKKRAKEEVISQLPEDPAKLACLTGVRAYINQNGEHVLLAFGQAGVEVVGGRADKAYDLAGKKARLRAMAAIRSFMGEKIAFTASEKLKEVLALYVNEYQADGGGQEYKSISQFQEMIRAEADKQKVKGLHGLLTKELVHPFTDRPMVLKVMAWSPSSQALASEMKHAIEVGAKPVQQVKPAARPQELDVPSRKGLISTGEGADPDAY